MLCFRIISKKVDYLEKYPEFAMVHSASINGETFHDQKNCVVSGLNGQSGQILNL